jgi:hypothetical protein
MTHPEMRDGEVLAFNGTDKHFRTFKWRTKRLGQQAYDIWGRRVQFLQPIFVQRTEIEALGEDPDQFEKNRERDREAYRSTKIAAILLPTSPLPES